jgi:hypothetical protein
LEEAWNDAVVSWSILLKCLLFLGFVAAGIGFWRLAASWKQNGEIPVEWTEATEPVKSNHPHFRLAVGWQRFFAILLWAFALLVMVSIVLELQGKV